MFYEKTGREALHYHLSPDEAEKLRRGEFVYDAQTGLTFAHNDIILNQHGLGETEAIIENIIQNVERGQHTPFIQLMTHEQYFYEDYAAWQPDFEEKLHSALRILHQKRIPAGFPGGCYRRENRRREYGKTVINFLSPFWENLENYRLYLT